MEDINKSAYYNAAMHLMEKNNAGEYEIIRNAAGVQDADSRLYYCTYIPASLQQVDEQQFLTDEWRNRLNFIYREIGKMQGLGFYETDFSGRNEQFYKQESISVLENDDIEIQLADVFSPRLSEDIYRKMSLYESMEEYGDHICSNILKGKMRINHQNVTFRQNQIWENTKFRKVSLLEYNPPTPEQVLGLMQDLEVYWNETIQIDAIIRAGLLAYQFLTIMPYEEDNAIWLSILLNCFLRQQDMESNYYIPFARYFAEQDVQRKMAMRQVRENGDYSIWIRFFVHVAETAIFRTNQAIMQLEQIRRHTLGVIENEKQKSLLQDIFVFMEKNPVFVIHDIEQEFQTAYNTAAKSVAILEKHDLVKEISNKQRYRVYCYEQYVREILK